MKRILWLMVVVLGVPFSGFGQLCLPEGITLNTQYSIDQFAANYPGCSSIAGNVTIGQASADITNLNGLSQLSSIGGNLYIFGCNGLANFSGLHNLTSVGGNLDVISNDGLSSMAGLNNLSALGGHITVSNNDGIASLAGLEKIEKVPGFVQVSYNESLVSLSGLQHIDTIEGNLYLSDNKILGTLNGLEGLRHIGTYLEIVGNKGLGDLNGLENLRYVGGDLSVYFNPLLHSLTGLQHLDSIGGGLYITSDDLLKDLRGLDSLKAVKGRLRIGYNPQLITLNGLENLKSIRGYLEIRDNPNLISLKALEHINAGSIVSASPSFDDIEIYNNPKLDTCAVASICDALSLPGTTTDIHGNASNCNSEPVIQALCDSMVGVDNIAVQNSAIIFPNPTSDRFTLQCGYHAYAALADQFGRRIYLKKLVPGDNEWDIRQLLPSVYFIKIDKGEVLRVVKQ